MRAGPFLAVDQTFSIVGDDDVAGLFEAALADLRTDRRATERITVKRHRNGEWSARRSRSDQVRGQPDVVVARTLQYVNRFASSSARDGIALHAAAVSTPLGVIALAGVSGAGKSTLAAAAVLDGYGFVADEVTAIDSETLTVTPFRRPLGLREGGAAAVGVDIPVNPDGRFDEVYPWRPAVGVENGRDHPTRLIGVFEVERCEDDPGPQGGEPLSGGAALSALARLSYLAADPVVAFRHAENIARRVPFVPLRFSDTADGLERLRSTIATFEPAG